jgi:hypothetical protein
VCRLNAAAVHDLTDEIPREVRIAVAAGSTSPWIDYPPVQVFRLKPATFELGLTEFEAAPGESVRIYDAAHTVVDVNPPRAPLRGAARLYVLNRYLKGPAGPVRPGGSGGSRWAATE